LARPTVRLEGVRGCGPAGVAPATPFDYLPASGLCSLRL